MTLTVPIKFKKILDTNDLYMSEILRLTTDFSNWIKDNNLEFFPEYTDHGIEHIQSVLDTAEDIISEASWNILTAEDVYVLISAVLLHDSAMHITKNGLWSLLTNDKFNGVVIGHQSDNTWLEKWKHFEKKVSRFEETDWNNFFGKYETVKLPKINDTNLDDNQKILIGDFVRQYHADIAEIIASHGIPIKDGSYDLFNNNFTSLNQIAGFIARSHNYNLRDMVDEIGGEHKARDFGNTHSAFLMGILRIADYLQFEQNRTPKILFKIKGNGMCSPISMKEWEKHLSILHTNKSHSDNELLFVETQPNDAHTLEEIKKLFKGFQYELDSFWAVNGEIYSRFPKLSSLGLNIRRIKSNIDNPYQYIELNNKKFHPEVLNIKSDNQKILPLLVGPLYGDIPQIGLRELIQNSIDACNERYSLDIHTEVNQEKIPYGVSITIDFDNNLFIIEDDGVGMDIDVVQNYFLKVGASYRYSEVWKATHSSDNTVYVPRTGKFGIGMLAGFLIGDEISIISKKEGLASDKAIKFTYSLNAKDIQVDFIDLITTGTKIVIKSNKQTLETIHKGFDTYKNNYDNTSSLWYFLDTPTIDIKVVKDKEENNLYNKHIIKKEDIFSNWNSVQNTALQGFFWKINKIERFYRENELYCNGIIIRGRNLPSIPIDIGFKYLYIRIGKICIFDNLGQFPLNLTRDDLVTKDFFEIEKLRDSVLDYYFKEISLMISKSLNHKIDIINLLREYSNLLGFDYMLPFIVFHNEILPIGDIRLKNKYVLFDFILENQNRGVIYTKDISYFNDIGYCSEFEATKEADTTKNAILKYILNLKCNSRYYNSIHNNENTGLDLDGWIFVKTYDMEKFSITEFASYDIVSIKIDDKWSVISTKCNINDIPEKGLEIIKDKKINSFIFAICKFNDLKPTEFSSLLDEYLVNK